MACCHAPALFVSGNDNGDEWQTCQEHTSSEIRFAAVNSHALLVAVAEAAKALTVWGEADANLYADEIALRSALSAYENQGCAKEREPGLYKALADLVHVAQTQLDQSATERGLVNCNFMAAARAALEKSKGWI